MEIGKIIALSLLVYGGLFGIIYLITRNNQREIREMWVKDYCETVTLIKRVTHKKTKIIESDTGFKLVIGDWTSAEYSNYKSFSNFIFGIYVGFKLSILMKEGE